MNVKKLLLISLLSLSGIVAAKSGDKIISFTTSKTGYHLDKDSVGFSLGFSWEIDNNFKVEVSNGMSLNVHNLVNPSVKVQYKI